MEALISAGHPPNDVWSYTPRRLKAFGQLAERRKRHEAAGRLALQATATRGDGADISKRVKDMTRD